MHIGLINLSIVIIARNEAKNITRAIESVLFAVNDWPNTEILLVDSASTDDTVEIAKQYPINIVRLKPTWFLSAAAGRYIGTTCTIGDLILFLDGDMELAPEWLSRSIPYALDHPQVAALSGYRKDIYTRNGRITGEQDWRRDPHNRILEVQFLSGAMLCRRSALMKVGGFQPFLKSEEEIDLCMRFRHAGYKVVRLPYLICRHYCIPMGSIAGTLRRLQLDLWLGYGQVPRYHLGTPLFWTYLSEQNQFAVHFAGIIITLASLILSLLFRNTAFFVGWLLIVLTSILFFAIKKHSVRKALVSFTIHLLIIYSSIRGFFMIPRSPSEYPTDAEIVKVVHNLGGLDGTSIGKP